MQQSAPSPAGRTRSQAPNIQRDAVLSSTSPLLPPFALWRPAIFQSPPPGPHASRPPPPRTAAPCHNDRLFTPRTSLPARAPRDISMRGVPAPHVFAAHAVSCCPELPTPPKRARGWGLLRAPPAPLLPVTESSDCPTPGGLAGGMRANPAPSPGGPSLSLSLHAGRSALQCAMTRTLPPQNCSRSPAACLSGRTRPRAHLLPSPCELPHGREPWHGPPCPRLGVCARSPGRPPPSGLRPPPPCAPRPPVCRWGAHTVSRPRLLRDLSQPPATLNLWLAPPGLPAPSRWGWGSPAFATPRCGPAAGEPQLLRCLWAGACFTTTAPGAC